ncbi:VOC family protein [Leucobacter sp. NPDC058333]|uniref:VOC family protein n=1 Tax=Leucobacter sp. NPDC058333 TaxID=3346450 RepID=UPI00365E8E2B
MSDQKIVPNIWCQGNAEEAGTFYARVFPDTASEVESRYPETGLLEFQKPLAGKPLTVAVHLAGFRLTLVNAGTEFAPNPSISMFLTFGNARFGDRDGARAALQGVWDQLADGGTVLMPLDTYPFSEYYGWVQDRFGMSWQLGLADASNADPVFVTPSLMFGGKAQNRAAAARDRYLEVFPDAKPGGSYPYGTPRGPATAESLMYSDFTLCGQNFSAMDSGVEQDFSFTCGVSLEVRCADQAEIDRLWEALSAVPEAEQCGWLEDEFGVSWQIVPENMGELMERPNAFEHMLEMHKIVIADL